MYYVCVCVFSKKIESCPKNMSTDRKILCHVCKTEFKACLGEIPLWGWNFKVNLVPKKLNFCLFCSLQK